ncbi:MMPL family transporter [Sulfurimonas sp. MAG313]|nr:MMPL family transporter [Sulfurimonas sp. MAG313]MDF1879881.1 MMPL family transporter [Sulfurimonas sp. MAG313]
MEKFINTIIKFKWFIAILIPLFTIAMGTQLKHLEFEGSYRIWFGEDSKILHDYDNFRGYFGNDDAVSIIFKDENGVMNKKALKVIDRITKRLWETPYIARVDSLTNYQYIHTNERDPDDILVEDFIQDIDSLSLQDLEKKSLIIPHEDQILGHVISKDLKTTMIIARMTPKSGDSPVVSKFLKEAVEKIVAQESDSAYEFHFVGGPILNMTFIELGTHDATTYTPIVLIISMVLLWIIFRRASGMLLSISVVIFTFVIVLSIQVMLGYKINNFTANIPVFIVAIGIADAMHLFWIYLMGRHKGLDNIQAIHYSVNKNFLPIFLTSLTTAVGFASLGISDVIPVKTLGIATANAALLAFILTILFVPAVLAIINPKIKSKDIDLKQKKPHLFSHKYAQFIINNDTKIILASFIIFASIGLGLAKVQVDSNTVRYFSEDVPFRKTVNFLQDNLTGPMSYEVVVDSKRMDGIKDPKFMKEVERFYIEFKQTYPSLRHISSLTDIVKKYNEVMNHSKTIPDSQNLIAQYLLLYSLSLPQGMEINDRMDVDEQRLRLSAQMNIVNTSLDLEMIEWITAWWAKTDYSATVQGQTAMFAHMQHDVTDTLIQSISLAILAVSFMMLVIFRRIRMIPFFIIPNVLPIVLVIGIMGWFGMTIDIGVAISGAIIIGVAVDDTIHFLIKYQEARRKGYNFEDSLSYVMQYAGSAIIFTTIILSSAFMIFSFSQFLPNVNFGIVTAVALVIAVLVDLLMLPALLSKFDGKDKSTLLA